MWPLRPAGALAAGPSYLGCRREAGELAVRLARGGNQVVRKLHQGLLGAVACKGRVGQSSSLYKLNICRHAQPPGG